MSATGEQRKSQHSVSGFGDILTSMSEHFNNPDMSDLELKVGNQSYYVHKFVLGLMSDVFRTMCSRRWDGDQNVMQVQESEECLPVFEPFLRFFYCGDIEIDVSTALPLLMLADKYNVEPLKEKFEDFMRKTVKDGSVTGALRWFTYAQVSGHSSLQFSCVDVIITKMDEVVASEDFLQLEIGFLVALLGRDDLVVLWEKTIYGSVARWISDHADISNEEVIILLKLVRFSMMLPEQLYEIEMSSFFEKYKDILGPLISDAHRFRSIATEVFDMAMFSEPVFRPRNYTHRLWCHFLTVETNGEAFFQNSIGVRCINHPVLATPEQLWQIRVMGDKRSSKNATGNKPTFLPNLGYVLAPTMTASSAKSIPLVMTITPLRPIKQDIVVDVALYQVKKDRLSKFLCQSSIKFSPEDFFAAIDTNKSPSRKCSIPGSSLLHSPPAIGRPKFSPSPMNFAVMFQQSQMSEKHEVTLRYNFTTQDFDHPAEIPCFKFNGPTRMTNSVRVAVIFKPRFASYPPPDDDLGGSVVEMPLVVQESYDSGVSSIIDRAEGDEDIF